MPDELDPRTLDAIVRSRRVKRRADLFDRARGRWTWQSFAMGLAVLTAAWLWIRWLETRHLDPWLPVLVMLAVIAALSEARTSRRLDALVELLGEREAEPGGKGT